MSTRSSPVRDSETTTRLESWTTESRGRTRSSSWTTEPSPSERPWSWSNRRRRVFRLSPSSRRPRPPSSLIPFSISTRSIFLRCAALADGAGTTSLIRSHCTTTATTTNQSNPTLSSAPTQSAGSQRSSPISKHDKTPASIPTASPNAPPPSSRSAQASPLQAKSNADSRSN